MIIWGLSSSDISFNCDLIWFNQPAYRVINLITSLIDEYYDVYFTIDQFSKFLWTFLICNSNFNYQPCVSNSDSFFCNCCGSFTFIYSKFCSVNSTTIVGVNTYLSQTHTTLASHFCLCEMISVVYLIKCSSLTNSVSVSWSDYLSDICACTMNVSYALTNICSAEAQCYSVASVWTL